MDEYCRFTLQNWISAWPMIITRSIAVLIKAIRCDIRNRIKYNVVCSCATKLLNYERVRTSILVQHNEVAYSGVFQELCDRICVASPDVEVSDLSTTANLGPAKEQ